MNKSNYNFNFRLSLMAFAISNLLYGALIIVFDKTKILHWLALLYACITFFLSSTNLIKIGENRK